MDNYQKIKFIDGQFCYLRPVLEKDITSAYLSWINNEEMIQYLECGRLPTSPKQLKDYIKRKADADNSVFLAIIDKKTNKHIGNVKLEPISWINRSTGFSIFIGDKENRNKGFGKEVVKLMLDCVFYRLNLRKVTLGVIEGNIRALNLYKKFGFSIEGRDRSAIYSAKNKRYVDIIRMGLLKGEYCK